MQAGHAREEPRQRLVRGAARASRGRARRTHTPRTSTKSVVESREKARRDAIRRQRRRGGDDADIDVDDASDAWAATSWARTAIAIKRVRATLQFEDEAQDAHSRMAKELTALAEVGFARMVRPHLPQPVVEDLYPR